MWETNELLGNSHLSFQGAPSMYFYYTALLKEKQFTTPVYKDIAIVTFFLEIIYKSCEAE